MSFSDYKKKQYVTELQRMSETLTNIYSEIQNSPLSSTFKGSLLGLSYHTYSKKIAAQNFTFEQLTTLLLGL